MTQKGCQVKNQQLPKKYNNLTWAFIEAAMGGMTQTQFAKKVGWRQRSYISNFKSGKVIPSDATLIQMATSTGMARHDVSRMMQAVAQDRVDKKQDTADEKALLDKCSERTRTQQVDKIDTASDVESQIISIDMGVDMVGLDETKIDEIATELIRWGHDAGAKPEEINQRVKGFYKLIEQLKSGQLTMNRDSRSTDKQKKS